MLKIQTLNPKQSKLIRYIKSNGLSQRTVAKCVGMNPQYFNEKLKDDHFDGHDSKVIKTVVDKLVAKRK